MGPVTDSNIKTNAPGLTLLDAFTIWQLSHRAHPAPTPIPATQPAIEAPAAKAS